MKKYVASWKASSHNDVLCDRCHFSPGLGEVIRAKVAASTHLIKTITDTAGVKPHAEIEDASCLRDGCHDTELLEGNVTFKGRYNFDHSPHLTKLRGGKKLRCTSCHSQVADDDHFAVTGSGCFLCHFKGKEHEHVLEPVAGCTACHDAPVEAITTTAGATFKHGPLIDRSVACWKCHAEATAGKGDVPKQVCVTCHSEPETLEKYADSTLMHDWHVTKRKVECLRCHSEIRHGRQSEPTTEQNDCARCHDAGHTAHGDMFAGRGGQGIPASPGKHYLAGVDCIACHNHEFQDPTKQSVFDVSGRRPSESACVSCHGKRIEGTLEDWQSTLDEMLAETKSQLDKAQQAYAIQPDDDDRKATVKSLLATARHDYEFVQKASGAHNLSYAMDLLDTAMEKAAEAEELAKESTPVSRNDTSGQ